MMLGLVSKAMIYNYPVLQLHQPLCLFPVTALLIFLPYILLFQKEIEDKNYASKIK